MRDQREQRALDKYERDRYRVHVLLYDFPGKRSFRAFLGYFRWPIFQIFWVAWSSYWTGSAMANGNWFSFWLNGILTPFIVLVTLWTWHTKVVNMTQTMLRNLQEIGQWMRRNGFDQDDPPSWFH